MTLPQYDEIYFDQDGYPTEEFLDWIRNYDHTGDYHALMEEVQAAWHWGKNQYTQYTEDYVNDSKLEVYCFSTGGWSGNESIIQALSDNTMFWMINWWQSRRGGHYIFKVRIQDGK